MHLAENLGGDRPKKSGGGQNFLLCFGRVTKSALAGKFLDEKKFFFFFWKKKFFFTFSKKNFPFYKGVKNFIAFLDDSGTMSGTSKNFLMTFFFSKL